MLPLGHIQTIAHHLKTINNKIIIQETNPRRNVRKKIPTSRKVELTSDGKKL
jgi:hypothetical protein